MAVPANGSRAVVANFRKKLARIRSSKIMPSRRRGTAGCYRPAYNPATAVDRILSGLVILRCENTLSHVEPGTGFLRQNEHFSSTARQKARS